MVYMVFDDLGILKCITQNWPRAYAQLGKLCGECVGVPSMQVWPDRAFSLADRDD